MLIVAILENTIDHLHFFALLFRHLLLDKDTCAEVDSLLGLLYLDAIQTTTIALFIQVLVLVQSNEIFTTLGIVVLDKLVL